MARAAQGLDAEAVQHALAVLDGYTGPPWTLEEIHLVASQAGYQRLWSVPVGS